MKSIYSSQNFQPSPSSVGNTSMRSESIVDGVSGNSSLSFPRYRPSLQSKQRQQQRRRLVFLGSLLVLFQCHLLFRDSSPSQLMVHAFAPSSSLHRSSLSLSFPPQSSSFLRLTNHRTWCRTSRDGLRGGSSRFLSSSHQLRFGSERLFSSTTRLLAHNNQRRLPREVSFCAPLLKYGYRPTVEEAQDGTLSERPLLLFLPGMDGTFLSPFLQFPELGTLVEIQCLTVGGGDRSTYQQLKETVLDFLHQQSTDPDEEDDPANDVSNVPSAKQQDNVEAVAVNGNAKDESGGGWSFSLPWIDNRQKNGVSPRKRRKRKRSSPTRPIYLAGESFGGILALDVALTILHDDDELHEDLNLQGVCLINPATCYDRSRLAAEAPAVAAYPPFLYPIGLMKLLPLFTDEYSMAQLAAILSARALPSVIDTDVREAYLVRVACSLPFVIPVLDQGTLQWRLEEWLSYGAQAHLDDLRLPSTGSTFQEEQERRQQQQRRRRRQKRKRPFRTLLIAGEQDACLPSLHEAERLADILRSDMVGDDPVWDVTVHVVEGAGHASTCGARVDLAALFRKTFAELRRAKIPSQQRKGNRQQRQQRGSKAAPAPVNGDDNLPLNGLNGYDYNFNNGRTQMKEIASQGTEEFLGMEPRYDNATIGLNPLRCWDPPYYRPYTEEEAPAKISKKTITVVPAKQKTKSREKATTSTS